jgi:hypothetical protein
LAIHGIPVYGTDSDIIDQRVSPSFSSRDLDSKALDFPADVVLEMRRFVESVISDADDGKKERIVGGLREALRGW